VLPALCGSRHEDDDEEEKTNEREIRDADRIKEKKKC
jgi:hypothetical protein